MSLRFGSGWQVIYFLICSCTFICSAPQLRARDYTTFNPSSLVVGQFPVSPSSAYNQQEAPNRKPKLLRRALGQASTFPVTAFASPVLSSSLRCFWLTPKYPSAIKSDITSAFLATR